MPKDPAARRPASPASAPSAPRVGVVLDANIAYSRDVLSGIAQYLRDHPAWHVVMVTNASLFDEALPHVDAVVGYITHPKRAAALARRGVPTVNIASSRAFPGCAPVYSDECAIGALAADHFLQRGFHNLASIGLRPAPFSASRQTGFAAGLTETEADPAEFTLEVSDLPQEQTDAPLTRFLAELPSPSGVFCVTDWVAHRVALLAPEMGRRIPEDLAILGVDNDIMICDFTNPALSSVQQATERIGYEACEWLAALLDGADPPESPVLIPPRGIVVRRSTDILAVEDPMVAEALRIIHRHPVGEDTLGEVLDAVPLSRRMLEMRFKKAMGRGIQEEIRRRRVDRIRYLLENTDQPLKQIAEDLAFSHVSYLTTFFKKHTGMTPSACRRQARRVLHAPPPNE